MACLILSVRKTHNLLWFAFRYMAPECLCNEPYNMKADVYSFAILLWAILSGEVPYAFATTIHELADFIVEEDGRPDIQESWPVIVKQILESSFDCDPTCRPVSALPTSR